MLGRAAAFAALITLPASAHDFVGKGDRAGAYPPRHGTGWRGQAFLNLPDAAATDLFAAEDYIAGRKPDFTFRTPWIDFPAGPNHARRDHEFDTLGDFLDDYIHDVSDPAKLDTPFGHFYLRFTGLVKVRVEDEIRNPRPVGPPVWVDFATMGHDGYRTKVVVGIYRVPSVEFGTPWSHFGPSLEVLGLYPMEVHYLNRYDPDNLFGTGRAGIELYSFHGSEKDYPAGTQMFHERFGFGTLVPPRIIYQPEDVQPVPLGDFDADTDLDLKDFQWLQYCSDPRFFKLPSGCGGFDFDGDAMIDGTDVRSFLEGLAGPAANSNPGED